MTAEAITWPLTAETVGPVSSGKFRIVAVLNLVNHKRHAFTIHGTDKVSECLDTCRATAEKLGFNDGVVTLTPGEFKFTVPGQYEVTV